MGLENIFRKEALAAHTSGHKDGALIEFDPRWARLTYWFVAYAFLGAIVFVCLFSVNEYATGPAIIRVNGRQPITATLPGTVVQVLAHPGQRVEAGELLVRLQDTDEKVELERVTHEYEAQLVRFLRDPTDSVAKQSLAALKSKMELAKNTVAQHAIKAPVSGIVSDIRVHQGLRIAPGDSILTLAPENSHATMQLILPGDYRPLLRRGLAVRFSLEGFPHEHFDALIESVPDEVIGPTEVKRYLGKDLFDAVQLAPTAQVIVQCTLPERTFTSNGNVYNYFDGLIGRGDVRVRTEPLAVTLLPALKELSAW